MAAASNGNVGTRAQGPRCIALVGPFQSGKTTLLEAILARTGAIQRQGTVEAGTSVGDASKEARHHKMSVELTVATTTFMDDSYTFIDCPGSVEFLHDMVPKAAVIGFLVNPKDPNADSDTREVQAAADVFGQKLVVAKASTVGEIDSAFATFVERRVAALFVDTDPFLADQGVKIVALAAKHALPAVSQLRIFAAAGGLASYGTSLTAANRQLGVYTGRVLKGTKPSDLPVIQSTTFELVINLKTAKALGLTIPPSLLQRADQVIE